MKDFTISDSKFFIGVTETWLLNIPNYTPAWMENYNIFWKEARRAGQRGRGSGGIAALVRKDFETELIESCNEWIFVKTKQKDWSMGLGTIYFKPETEVQASLDRLKITIDRCKEHFDATSIIIGGDFNARMGGEDENLPEELLENSALYRKRSMLDKTTTKRGQELQEFMGENGFILANGRTVSDTPGSFTYSSTIGNSTVDLIWANILALDLLEDVKISDEITDSDHFPVDTRIKINEETNNAGDTGEHEYNAAKTVKWKPERAEIFS